jgi:hypothetical protein
LAADFDSSRWQYRSSFRVAGPAKMTAVRLNKDAYARSSFGDLRVVRGAAEVPYILETLSGRVVQRELSARILDKTLVDGPALRVTLDLGEKSQHSRLRFETEEKNFKRAVRVETSEDNRTWPVARAAGYIFDVSEGDAHAAVLHVDYPLSTRRYVRATLQAFTTLSAIRRVLVAHYVETQPEWERLTSFTAAGESAGKDTVAVLHFGAEPLRHSRLTLEVSDPLFHRTVEVASSDDGKQWRSVLFGTIYRVPGEESLSLRYGEQRQRHVRVTIHNGDDRPLQLHQIWCETVRRVVKIPPAPAGDYWLYYSNPAAPAPQYDLARILAKQDPSTEDWVQAGAQEANPIYSPPPKPFSDRYPGLLNGALAVAVLGMGAITVRFMKKVRTG